MVFLIPLDIYTTIVNKDVAEPALIWIWYVYYWGSFILNWTLFPFTVHYLEAGEFTWSGKAWYSVKQNAPWYLLYGIIFGVLCCFLYFTDSGQKILIQGGGLVGVIIGMTLVGGLIWLSLTLGYGIVKIPIRFYQYSSLQSRLNFYQYRVAKFEDEIHELLFEKTQSLQKICFAVDDVLVRPAHERYKTSMQQLAKSTLEQTGNISVFNRIGIVQEQLPTEEISYSDLVKLNKSLMDSCSELFRLWV